MREFTASGRQSAGRASPVKGIVSGRRTSMRQSSMLDKRDIQTLMYCVRLAEANGGWREASPTRSPHDLECKLAALLRQVDQTHVVKAA